MPYITANSTPTNSICWRIYIPDDDIIFAAFLGQLLELSEAENWENIGGITEQESADIWDKIYDDFTHQSGCMIGTIQNYVNAIIPSNMLPCDGSQYLRVDYPKLYAVLPISLVIDADNFITPTLDDKITLNSGLTHIPLSTGGQDTITPTVAQLPEHNHTTQPHNHIIAGAVASTLVINAGAPTPMALAVSTSSQDSTVIVDNSGNGEPIDILPPYVALSVGIVAK